MERCDIDTENFSSNLKSIFCLLCEFEFFTEFQKPITLKSADSTIIWSTVNSCWYKLVNTFVKNQFDKYFSLCIICSLKVTNFPLEMRKLAYV